MTAADNEYPKASNATLIGASITYVAGLFLLLSFAGPYWIESYPEMFSSFKHMGLWEYCFDRFRFPTYPYRLFHGCHYIFSEEFYVIREWLLPGWLTAVQSFVTLALILSLTAQVLLACVIMRWPLRAALRYEWIFVSCSFAMVTLSSAAAILLYFESRKLYELRLEAKNLVAQMHHSQPEHALQHLREQLQQQRHGWN
ncbi:uncharacterized protein LOC106138407 isoform X2 [Amyelois transitella]|uniref:uncharacterized protein LOC106138407 isoform X2 n=1 Tax=Amyelois transitella TaxID=680683 RepID=UPI00067AC294|nr:uncharacterized protein LOC106138407 isoform X2 [Amyelois transitella]